MQTELTHAGALVTVFRGKLVITKAEVHGRRVLFASSHPRDVIQKHHMSGRFYEEEELEIIRRHLPPSSVFVDIGANCGNHSLFVGLYLNPRRIICFEPNPAITPALSTNIHTSTISMKSAIFRISVWALGATMARGLAPRFPSATLARRVWPRAKGTSRSVEAAACSRARTWISSKSTWKVWSLTFSMV